MLARMGQRFVCVILALLVQLTACRTGRQAAVASENAERSRVASSDGPKTTTFAFDYYLLNLSWSPEFCHSHTNAVECGTHAAFVLHGLWPQKNDGSYPENCSSAPGPADASAYKDIYPDEGLLRHEWQTHGTCSGLGPDEFFAAARTAYRSVAIPPVLLSLSSQTTMPPEEILGLFTATNPAIQRASLALSCGNNYLTAVEVCLDKSLHAISCPGIRSCRANVVRIPPP